MNTKDDDDVDDTMESLEPSKSEPLIETTIATAKTITKRHTHTGIQGWSQTQ